MQYKETQLTNSNDVPLMPITTENQVIREDGTKLKDTLETLVSKEEFAEETNKIINGGKNLWPYSSTLVAGDTTWHDFYFPNENKEKYKPLYIGGLIQGRGTSSSLLTVDLTFEYMFEDGTTVEVGDKGYMISLKDPWWYKNTLPDPWWHLTRKLEKDIIAIRYTGSINIDKFIISETSIGNESQYEEYKNSTRRYADHYYVNDKISTKQNKLVEGTGIIINQDTNKISVNGNTTALDKNGNPISLRRINDLVGNPDYKDFYYNQNSNVKLYSCIIDKTRSAIYYADTAGEKYIAYCKRNATYYYPIIISKTLENVKASMDDQHTAGVIHVEFEPNPENFVEFNGEIWYYSDIPFDAQIKEKKEGLAPYYNNTYSSAADFALGLLNCFFKTSHDIIVKSVNGNLPDENGNVTVETGGGGSGNNTFIATYGETTFAELKAAYDAGKTLYCDDIKTYVPENNVNIRFRAPMIFTMQQPSGMPSVFIFSLPYMAATTTEIYQYECSLINDISSWKTITRKLTTIE